jgi:hypothetical protein
MRLEALGDVWVGRAQFQYQGVDTDAQQASAFRSIQQALASSMQMNNRALVQAQRVFKPYDNRPKWAAVGQAVDTGRSF